MIQQHLNKLKPVNAGMLLTDAVTAARINAIQDAIKALARGDNLLEGNGTRIRRGPSGAMISRLDDLHDDERQRWQHRTFQYIADGVDEAIESIGQDPAEKTVTHGTVSGSAELLRHGGMHKMDGFLFQHNLLLTLLNI